MKPNTRNSICEKLRKAIGKTVVFPKDKPPDLPSRHHGIEINFAYDDRVRQDFDEVVELLVKQDGWSERVSEKAIYDRIFDVVRVTLLANGGSSFDQNISRLFALFDEHSVEQMVWLPLYGIAMECEKMRIGRAMLENMTQERIAETVSANPGLLGDSLKTGPEEGVYAVFRAVAEPQRAKEIAIDETRRALDLLRLSIILLKI